MRLRIRSIISLYSNNMANSLNVSQPWVAEDSLFCTGKLHNLPKHPKQLILNDEICKYMSYQNITS